MIGALLLAEWRRTVAEMVRYPVETISATVTLFLIFAGLFFGAQYITGSPIGGGRLASAVLGYAVWMIMMAATQDMAWSVQNEAQNGTLEQVMTVPWAPTTVFLVRGMMAVMGFLIPAIIVVAALIVMTGVHLAWSTEALWPMVMVLVTAWGLGLMVAGVALILKRVGQVLQIVNFLLLFLILSPLATLAGWYWHLVAMLVPFTAQATLLKAVLDGGTGLSRLVWIEAVVNMAVLFVLGCLVFYGADRLARRRGILGHY
jgi:ABC-2 type transport system permease protein